MTTTTDSEAMAGLRELVTRAKSGDRTVLPQLREYLDEHPEIWTEVGDLALHAQESWLALMAGQDLVLEESVRRKMDELRGELGSEAASKVEKLLIERVVACWLQVHYADAAYAQAKGPAATASVRREMMQRQSSAQHRYLTSLKQLAIVRKLLKSGPSPMEFAQRGVLEGPPAKTSSSTRGPGPTPRIARAIACSG